MDSNRTQKIESVQRATQIMRMMLDEGSVSVTDAASRLEINPSTAYRTLDTLASEGFAQQIKGRRYAPGPHLLRAGLASKHTNTKTQVRPFLELLFSLTNETVHLASLVGATVTHHDCIEATEHTLVFTNRLQKRIVAHLSSEGKSMLAELSASDVNRRFVQAASAFPHTPPPDLQKLHLQLEETRRKGFATNFEESEKGIAAMAISLGQIDGEHLSLSVALPIARYSPESGARIQEALLKVKTEARAFLSSESGVLR